MRYAVINKTGKVDNIIELEDKKDYPVPEGSVIKEVQNTSVSPGDTFDGQLFHTLVIDKTTEQTAFELFIKEAKENKTGAPWGRMMYNLSIANGWIKE